MADRRTVAEGAFTAPVLRRLAEERGVDMPMVTAVDGLLSGRFSVDAASRTICSPGRRAPEGH